MLAQSLLWQGHSLLVSPGAVQDWGGLCPEACPRPLGTGWHRVSSPLPGEATCLVLQFSCQVGTGTVPPWAL